jgi:pyocin large subunit-like protein
MSLEWYRHVLTVYQETSRAAWESVWILLPAVDASIVRVIADHGATSAEVEAVTGLKHQTVSAQIRHMVEAGLLEDSGERRVNEGNRRCIVWRLAAPRESEPAAVVGPTQGSLF